VPDRVVARSVRAESVVVAAIALTIGTLVVALLETGGVGDASPVAVVTVAVVAGTWPAIGTAIGAFLVYDFLFIEPRYVHRIDPRNG
jgi:K+-sensing histidine kinase KdpD